MKNQKNPQYENKISVPQNVYNYQKLLQDPQQISNSKDIYLKDYKKTINTPKQDTTSTRPITQNQQFDSYFAQPPLPITFPQKEISKNIHQINDLRQLQSRGDKSIKKQISNRCLLTKQERLNTGLLSQEDSRRNFALFSQNQMLRNQQQYNQANKNNFIESDSDTADYIYFKRITKSPPTPLPISKESAYNWNQISEKFLRPEEKFFKSYKNLSQIVDKNFFFKVDNDLFSQMLSPTLNTKILPKRFGLNNEDEIKNVSLNYFQIGKNYSKMFGNALRHDDLKYIESLNASKNYFDQIGLEDVVQSIPRSISVVELSNNKINPKGCESIQHLIDSKQFYKLQQLNLSRNEIGDQGAIIFANNLLSNTCLKILDLSFNNLTEKAVQHLSDFIKQSTYLFELYLQWNNLGSIGGKILAQSLKQNDYLCVLDISHNNLGNGYPITSSGEKIISAITKKNSTMKHLDLSFNNYSVNESAEIQVELLKNHTLYGFHFNVNSRGFLVQNKFAKLQSIHLAKMTLNPRIKGVKQIQNLHHLQKITTEQEDVCWICQGWVEHRFDYKTSNNSQINQEPVFLHINFEDFEPILMERDTKDADNFLCFRMLPPETKVCYFFSNPLQQKTDISHMKGVHSENAISCTLSLNYCKQNIWNFESPTIVNLLQKLHTKPLIGSDYESIVSSFPRDNGGNFEFNKSDLLVWKIEKSVFKDYRGENEDILQKCFDFDWNCSRIKKFVKKDQDLIKLKEILRSVYPFIIHHYKYYSAINLSSDVFCVSSNSFTEFFTQGTNGPLLIDGIKLKIRDLDLQFVATNTSSCKIFFLQNYNNLAKNNHLNPDRALVRYQFMEILVRLATDKYLKLEDTISYCQAFQKMLDEGLKDILNIAEDYQQWRYKRLWNKEKTEYRSFTNRVFMTLNEFKDIWQELDFFDEFFVERDVPISFNLAMQLNVDELDIERHMQMNFSEFIEAFSRIAEKFSPIPIEEDPNDWTEAERISQNLSEKIGNFIDLIIEIKQIDKNQKINENLKTIQKQLDNMQTKLQQQQLLKKKLANQNYLSPIQPSKQSDQFSSTLAQANSPKSQTNKLNQQVSLKRQSTQQEKRFANMSSKKSIVYQAQQLFLKQKSLEKNILNHQKSISENSENSDSQQKSDSESDKEEDQNTFLNYVKLKKNIKFDNSKAQKAYDEIYSRIVVTTKKYARKRSNLLDLTINAGGPALKQFSVKFKMQMQKWGIGMPLAVQDADQMQEQSENSQEENN